MLFILFGTTGELGFKSRAYFAQKGFEVITKYNCPIHEQVNICRYKNVNYVSKDVSKEVVESCDFTYESNGRLVGFNENQIIDSVCGRKNCLLTLSSNTVDFIQQIKAAYGEYVTVAGLYIDDQQLEKLTDQLSDMTKAEKAMRLSMGEHIKKTFLKSRNLFDELVIYGGEDSLFNYKALFLQYDYLIEKAARKEELMNNRTYVEMPYSGSNDYIFVSYSHADSNVIHPLLTMLQRNGCCIWYDEGIKGGENWRKLLAMKIKSCRQFVLFSSQNAIQSQHIQAEINAAFACEKPIVVIRLDDARFELHYEMYLENYHNLQIEDKKLPEKLIQSILPSCFVV